MKILPSCRRFFTVCASIFLFIGLISTCAYAKDPQPSTYTVGNGDLIEVNVYNHPELSKQMRVRPDGWISLPLAGEVLAAGYTPGNLSRVIREKLLDYLKDPKVSVIVMDYASKKVLVLGEVKKPGQYQYEGAMTAFDAIGAAGGYEKHAELKSILIVHNAYSKTPKFELANLYRAIHDGSLAGNVGLVPGDIVYVPQNFIGNTADFLDFWMSRVRPAADTYFLYDIAVNDD
jgi:polysaccharide export outer membrane protein